MNRLRTAALLGVALLFAGSPGLARALRAADGPAGAAPEPVFDPVAIRTKLLARADRRIEEEAARAHLEARLALDEAMPLPYLGIDAEPKDGAMEVTHVYPATGAATAGLKAGDLVASVDGVDVDSKPSLGREIRRHAVGKTLSIHVRRGGVEFDVGVVLGRRPEEDEDEDEQFQGNVEPDAPAPKATMFSFEADAVGSTPAALESLLGGHGRAGAWLARREGDAGFLRQGDMDPTGTRFPLALVRDFSVRDVKVRVRFRLVAGDQDRAAGIVLRWQNPANYLVARVNASEKDLRIFRTVNNIRRTLPGGRVVVPADDGAWHVLEFRADGPRLTASLDGKTEASSYDTYFGRGRVGLWTKSDATTDFDDLLVEPILESSK